MWQIGPRVSFKWDSNSDSGPKPMTPNPTSHSCSRELGWWDRILGLCTIRCAIWNTTIWCMTRPRYSKMWMRLFTALHRMQTRSSDENSVCPFVRLSVKHVLCDKMEERSVQIFISYERTYSLAFWEKEWLTGGGERPLAPLEQQRRFWTDNRS